MKDTVKEARENINEYIGRIGGTDRPRESSHNAKSARFNNLLLLFLLPLTWNATELGTRSDAKQIRCVRYLGRSLPP